MDLAHIGSVEGAGQKLPSLLLRLDSPQEDERRRRGEPFSSPLYSEFIPRSVDEYVFNRRVNGAHRCANGHRADGEELLLYGEREGPWYCGNCHVAHAGGNPP